MGGKILAREDVKALKKDVLAKCYGGDISRKMKLLKHQAEGKKKMKKFGNSLQGFEPKPTQEFNTKLLQNQGDFFSAFGTDVKSCWWIHFYIFKMSLVHSRRVLQRRILTLLN